MAAAAPSGVDAAPRDHQRDPRIPLALAKTAVCRRVPPSVRARLDQALLAPPEDCLTLEAIADRFQLQSRYGLSPKALKTYAARLQELIRPSVTSHLIAAVLGLLPQDYRDRLLAGTQVLFLSRLAQALNLEHEDALSVGELAKLASILGQLGGPRAGRSNAPAGRRLARPGAGLDADRNQEDTIDAGNAVTSDVTSPVKLAEAVRAVYGIDWPGGPK